MTTTDHPTDRRSAIMDAARATVAELDAQVRAEHARRADEAVAAVGFPAVSRFLEDYGLDVTSTAINFGACADPAHALAWIAAAGFEFEVVDEPHRYLDERRPVVWLLHPETGARVCRISNGTSWEHVASLLVAESVDNPTPEPEPRDHPAEVLVDALRAFIDSRTSHGEVGF